MAALATVTLYNPANPPGELVRFPAAPASAEQQESGVSTRFSEARSGSISRRRGREETKWNLAATLYGPSRAGLRFLDAYLPPAAILAQLERWHKTDSREGTRLRLFMDLPGEQVAAEVYVGQYTARREGAFGDVALTLSLIEYRALQVRGDGEEDPTDPTSTPADDGAPADQTYTVQDGDTLMDIAALQLGSPDRWREIYDANTAVLAEAQTANGVPGVDPDAPDPDLIFPGTVLVIPGGTVPPDQPGDADPAA